MKTREQILAQCYSKPVIMYKNTEFEKILQHPQYLINEGSASILEVLLDCRDLLQKLSEK